MAESFHYIDPLLGAIVTGAKLTRHGASYDGAKIVLRGSRLV
jgi:hypothetical protein